MDTVVKAMGAQPVSDLFDQLQNRVAEIYRIGDADRPRTALEAVAEGLGIGRRI